MAKTGGNAPLFSNSARDHDRNRSVGQSMWEYLDNSADPRDAVVRSQLESMVEALPAHHRDAVIRRLKDSDHRRFNETLAELVVHHALTQIGRDDIEVAPSTTEGESDYRLSDIGLHIEVTRIGTSDQSHGERQRKYAALEQLNQLDCGAFSLTGRLRAGKSQPSMKRVRAQIRDWLKELDATQERAALEADPNTYTARSKRITFDDWTLVLHAYPLPPGAPSENIVARIEEPFTAGPVNVESIRLALAKKRQQHRSLTEPLLIVLDVSQGHPSVSTLADSLYGQKPLQGWNRPIDRSALWATPQRSGCQPSKAATTPPIVGVLVLDHLYVSGLDAIEATLWHPPNAGASPLTGPWATARWLPGAGSGSDLDITAGPRRYLLDFR